MLFSPEKSWGLNNLEEVRAYSGLKIGATSIGHTTYTYGRTFAWLLNLKEPKFILGYASMEDRYGDREGRVGCAQQQYRRDCFGEIPMR